MATYNYKESGGVILVDTSQIKSDVEAEYKEMFGQQVSTESQSEIGRMISGEITSRSSVSRNMAYIANQINPDQSENIFLDAVAGLFDIDREPDKKSSSLLTLTGLSGTPIPENSYVRDINGNLWLNSEASEIPDSGSVDVMFYSETFGAINAGAGEINKIISGVIGWYGVTNQLAAVPGRLYQSDESLRVSIKQRKSINARSSGGSVVSSIAGLDGVRAVKFRENRTGETQTIDDVEMTRNSIWACVDGGESSEIAGMLINRSGGVGFNGAVTVDYELEYSGQVISVSFDRPTEKPIMLRITAKIGLETTDNIKQSVIDYAGSEDQDNAFYLGNDSSPFEIASAINESLPSVFVKKIEVAEYSGSPVFSTETLINKIYEKATISSQNIEVITV